MGKLYIQAEISYKIVPDHWYPWGSGKGKCKISQSIWVQPTSPGEENNLDELTFKLKPCEKMNHHNWNQETQQIRILAQELEIKKKYKRDFKICVCY